jgi:hypothetical protein
MRGAANVAAIEVFAGCVYIQQPHLGGECVVNALVDSQRLEPGKPPRPHSLSPHAIIDLFGAASPLASLTGTNNGDGAAAPPAPDDEADPVALV